jgi:hypothetical protein
MNPLFFDCRIISQAGRWQKITRPPAGLLFFCQAS